MPLYESVIIARQDISAGQVEELADQLTTLLADNGGEVKKRELWGRNQLNMAWAHFSALSPTASCRDMAARKQDTT